MTTLKKITTYSTALCLAVTLMTSCSGNHDDAKEVAQESNEEKFDGKEEKGADHLLEAYSGNLFEIKASENAAMNATDAEVKKIATMMVQAHTSMNESVKSLADSKQVSLPADLSDEQRKDIEKLAEKTGLDYDKEYISMMKDKHEKTEKKLEKISDKCDDADIKSWAASTLPEVRHHLEMVNATHENLKNRK